MIFFGSSVGPACASMHTIGVYDVSPGATTRYLVSKYGRKWVQKGRVWTEPRAGREILHSIVSKSMHRRGGHLLCLITKTITFFIISLNFSMLSSLTCACQLSSSPLHICLFVQFLHLTLWEMAPQESLFGWSGERVGTCDAAVGNYGMGEWPNAF